MLLLLAGLAGGAGLAWNAGIFDWLMASDPTQIAANGNGATTTQAPAEINGNDADTSAAIEEQLRQLGMLRAEIERLAGVLALQNE
jgi:hypothetical protein